MSDITVEKLAKIVGTPVDKLLDQMKDAGVSLTGPEDVVSDEQKQLLLAYLKKSHGESASDAAGPKKITLKRTTKSSLKLSSSGGKAKTVSVEVRKKRTYVKRPDSEEQIASTEDAVPVEELVAEEPSVDEVKVDSRC